MGHHDVIVVGLGAMGSAAAYQLARRGVSVLGIDRYAPPHDRGSSHGDTRITRLAIGEGAVYTPLALRSHELWREIEAQTGADLLTTNGMLMLSQPGNTQAVHGKRGFLERTIAVAEQFGIEHEVLDSAALQARFPQLHAGDGEHGYLEPGGGFLRPERCIAAQLELAARHGATVVRGETFLRFTAHRDGVSVTTSAGEHSAGALVLSTGPWLPDLLPDPWRAAFGVYRQTMHWFDVAPPVQAMEPESLPVYIWTPRDRMYFYGFPAVDGPAGGAKVATEGFARTTHPDTVERDVRTAESEAFFDEVLATRLPLLRRQRVKAVSCLYTSTRDGDFVIDRHPDTERVLLVSPCSGHGFKHSAAIGEALAERLAEGHSRVDLAAFSLQRFA